MRSGDLRDVRERLSRFGLSLHQDKTRLVEFGRFSVMNRRQRGVGKPETFDFLGFTHYCTTTRRGRFRLGRKPVAKRVNRTLARIDEVLRKRWHHDIWEVGKWLGRVCEGWLNYFAVPGSGRFIRAFLRRLQRRWMWALRRRSQRARFSWKRLERMTEILWATRLHPPPMAGPAVYRQSPEVGAGWFNDHVRICAGGAQQCAFLPQLGGGARQRPLLPGPQTPPFLAEQIGRQPLSA